MAFNLAPFIRQRFFDSNGDPLTGGFLYTYQAMSSTPQATYTDSGGGTENDNPVELDANGEANIWLDVSLSYKFVLKDSNNVEQWTVDNVIGLLENDSVPTAALQDLAVTTAKINTSAVTNAKMANMVQSTVKGRAASAGTGAPVDLTPQQVRDIITKAPTVQRFTSGSGTYTPTSDAKWLRVLMVGGGGGGGGSGTTDGGASGNGVDTTFGTLTAGGGVGANRGSAGGAGGVPSVGKHYGNPGGASSANSSTIAAPGGYGGNSALFGGGGNAGYAAAAGGAGVANTGGGGAGGGIATNTGVTGGGGGAGACIDEYIAAASVSYAVGTGGAAGTAGSSGQAGGAGGSGYIEVWEFYQ